VTHPLAYPAMVQSILAAAPAEPARAEPNVTQQLPA
jgi:hypothetical protein